MADIRRVDAAEAAQVAAEIARIKRAVWPEEQADVTHLATALDQPDRCTLVAEVDGALVGFVDGFLTLAADGSRRWEVDLLAVDPAHQGRGLGRTLVAACTAVGRDFDADYARALIRASNVPSQRAFHHAGYTPEPEPLILWIDATDGEDSATIPPGVYLIPVITLGYRGLWIEGRCTAAAFRAARAVRTRYAWDSAGAVIPRSDVAANDAAQQVGFTPLGAPPEGGWAWWRLAY